MLLPGARDDNPAIILHFRPLHHFAAAENAAQTEFLGNLGGVVDFISPTRPEGDHVVRRESVKKTSRRAKNGGVTGSVPGV